VSSFSCCSLSLPPPAATCRTTCAWVCSAASMIELWLRPPPFMAVATAMVSRWLRCCARNSRRRCSATRSRTVSPRGASADTFASARW